MSAKIKILMVDDHKLVREGLKQLLEESGEIVVAAEASNGLQALEEARRSEYSEIIPLGGPQSISHLSIRCVTIIPDQTC